MSKLNIISLSQNKKDLGRLVQILNILVKYQVGRYVDKLISRERLNIRISRHKSTPEIERMKPPERLALMFGELGTTFVKFGQLLATRDDLIGPEYAAELSKLHDDVKPFSTQEAKRIISEEFGKPVSEIFSNFEDKPIASASIAQVHRATLKNGKKVVIKVQRPGIEEVLKEDIRIMHYIAYLAEKNIPESHKFGPEYLVNDFERSTMRELDFLREARNSERLKENFKDQKGFYVPKVYDDLCTKRVLTMEEIKGTKLTKVIASSPKGINKSLIARRLLQAYVRMILIDGFYHADPHPGNIMVMGHDVICFLDFGRCTSIDKNLSESMFRLVLSALNNDPTGLVSQLVRTNMIEEDQNLKDMKADFTDLLDESYSPNIKNIKVGNVLEGLMNIISKYEFNRPRELADLARTLIILEGVETELDPNFNISEQFMINSKEYLVNKSDPSKLKQAITDNIIDLGYMVKDLPGKLKSFMERLSEGKITVQLEHKNLDTITADIKNVGDKLSIALILSALIIGSSIVGFINKPLGLVFFVISGAIGIWMLLKILVF